MSPPQPVHPQSPSRRRFLVLTGAGAAGSLAAFAGLPASPPPRPSRSGPPPTPGWTTARRCACHAPAAGDNMIEQGLPLGNGRLGALVGADPARELLHVTDATLWTGGANTTLDGDGQFPYGRDDFGSFTLLARVMLYLPGHERSAVTDYRRTLDLSNGLVTTTYTKDKVRYTREMFASAPDDTIVVRLRQSGGGSLTGAVILSGTHGETTGVDKDRNLASFSAALGNKLRYAAAVTAAGDGTITATGTRVTFTDCSEVTLVISGGTDYAPDHATGFRNPDVDPSALAQDKALAAARDFGRTAARHARRRLPRLLRPADPRPRPLQRRAAPDGHLDAPEGPRGRRIGAPTPNSRRATSSSAAT